MLILLPPSEGKSAPSRGKPLDLASLSSPILHRARAEVLGALVSLCAGSPQDAATALGLGPTQADEVVRNARLTAAPTARADRVYSGVLYEALGLSALDSAAKRRATARLGIVSGLFGLLRPSDHIPAYRLSGQVTLPGLGIVARHWSRHLAPAVEDAAGDGLVVDLRSSSYAAFWRPDRAMADRTVTIRVLHEVEGVRKVVSHFNKATKGRLVQDLILDGSTPRRPGGLADLLADLGWRVETGATAPQKPTQLDVVVAAL